MSQYRFSKFESESVTTQMTCKELYECDPGFRGFIQAWVANKRCPLELADYLMDRGWDEGSGPVQAVMWTTTIGSKEANGPYGDGAGRYPYPGIHQDNYWWCRHESEKDFGGRIVPHARLPKHCVRVKSDLPDRVYVKTREEAMVWLLDNWIPS